MATERATSVTGIGQATANVVENQPWRHGTSSAETLAQLAGDGQYAEGVGVQSVISPTRIAFFILPDQKTTKV